MADAEGFRIASAKAGADILIQAILAKSSRGRRVFADTELAWAQVRDYGTNAGLLECKRSTEEVSSRLARGGVHLCAPPERRHASDATLSLLRPSGQLSSQLLVPDQSTFSP